MTSNGLLSSDAVPAAEMAREHGRIEVTIQPTGCPNP
jgi:hypothetical protein